MLVKGLGSMKGLSELDISHQRPYIRETMHSALNL